MANSISVTKKSQEIEVLSAADVKKIDDAVKFINNKANATAKSLIDIGHYLLKSFFDNDISKVEDRGSRKGISLRKIADHQDISVSFMSLSNAIRLADQDSLFSDPKFKSLTETHKLTLLNLPNDDLKKSFAEEAVKEKMSVRALREKLIDNRYILPRGRSANREEKTNSQGEDEDIVITFFAPIEQLSEFNIDNVDESQLTQERITVLEALKERIERLLAKAPKT